MTIKTGMLIGNRYQIDKKLGEGGVGAVYRARDRRTNSWVAVKVLSQELAQNADFLQRFQRQQSFMFRLQHPNVVRLLDWMEEQGNRCLVMEYVDGGSLTASLRQRPLPVSEAVDLALQLCEGLAYIHQQGILHRDLKAHNVLLTRDRKAKINDFDMAGFVAAARRGQTGLIGNIETMAPEVIQGGQAAADERAEIYSLGIICYQMLAGRSPFVADHPAAVANMHLEQPPPALRSFNPQVPTALEKVILRALEKDPARRYPSATAFAEALRQAANRATRGPKAQTSSSNSFWLIGAGVVAAVIFVVVIAMLANGGPREMGVSGGSPAMPTLVVTTQTAPSTSTASSGGRGVSPTSTLAPRLPTVSPTQAQGPGIAPTATSGAIPTPATTTTVYATPELLAPAYGFEASVPTVTLRWRWSGSLGPNEHFDVRLWPVGAPQHAGIAWTRQPEYLLDFRALDPNRFPPGPYHWAVAVIRGSEGRWEHDLSAESPSHLLVYK